MNPNLRAFVPLWLVALPYHYFRYHSMRYRFDAEGITMSWGVLFRRETTLTYARRLSGAFDPRVAASVARTIRCDGRSNPAGYAHLGPQVPT